MLQSLEKIIGWSKDIQYKEVLTAAGKGKQRLVHSLIYILVLTWRPDVGIRTLIFTLEQRMDKAVYGYQSSIQGLRDI